MDELCESLNQLFLIQPLGEKKREDPPLKSLRANALSKEAGKHKYTVALTLRTSCLKGAGSTQLIRRSNRSIMAEASMCFSTRPMKPSFFLKKEITWKGTYSIYQLPQNRLNWASLDMIINLPGFP